MRRFPPGSRWRTSASAASTSPTSCSTGYDTLILVDAAPRGEEAGTVFVLEPDFEHADRLERGESGFVLDAHGMDPEMVLGILADLGGKRPRVLIVGCEPAELREHMGLSAPVARAVEEAARVVRELIEQECGREPAGRADNDRNGGRRMIGRLLGAALAIGVAYVVVTSLPDVARYLKIRDM